MNISSRVIKLDMIEQPKQIEDLIKTLSSTRQLSSTEVASLLLQWEQKREMRL